MPITVTALHRFPVKGLSPEPLQQAMLTTGGWFPQDRLYAIENGPSGFDATAPVHQPKIKYLMLMRDEALARLRSRYDDATTTLAIADGTRELARGDLSTPDGRATIEAFVTGFMGQSLRGPARMLTAPESYRFTDSRSGFVSLLNLASVAAIEDFTGAAVDPLRFRANVHLEGLTAFAELDLVGTVLRNQTGLALKIIKRTERCAATNVDPVTGARDLAIPRTLLQRLGHADCGVYAQVLAGGVLAQGDHFRIEHMEKTDQLPF